MIWTSGHHLRMWGCPYPPRIHNQRWRIGAVLTGKMTISSKDCFTKVVPNDDTDIWTPSPDVRMPLSSKDPPPEMEDRESLDREDDHFKQRLFYKTCSKWWYRHLDTISGCQDVPYPPRIHHQRWRIGAVLTGKMTISSKDCFTKVVPNDDTDIWTPSPDVRMPLSSKYPQPEMEDRGSLDREDDHFKQRLLYKSCSKWWYGHLDTISGCQETPILQGSTIRDGG